MRKNQEPTCTSLVLAELKGSDDFRTVKQLCTHTQLSSNRVIAALCHLKAHKCVDFVSDATGTWWFATVETDDRCKTVEQRAPETKPRTPRKPKAKKEASK